MPRVGPAITIRNLVYQARNDPSTDPPAAGGYEAALRAGCETLLELQLIKTSLREDPNLSDHLARAISSLRSALFQLRIVSSPQSSGLTFGFVIGREPDGPADQSRPWRTA